MLVLEERIGGPRAGSATWPTSWGRRVGRDRDELAAARGARGQMVVAGRDETALVAAIRWP